MPLPFTPSLSRVSSGCSGQGVEGAGCYKVGFTERTQEGSTSGCEELPWRTGVRCSIAGMFSEETKGANRSKLPLLSGAQSIVATPFPILQPLASVRTGRVSLSRLVAPSGQGFLASAGSRVLRATSFKASSGISPGHHSLKWEAISAGRGWVLKCVGLEEWPRERTTVGLAKAT